MQAVFFHFKIAVSLTLLVAACCAQAGPRMEYVQVAEARSGGPTPEQIQRALQLGDRFRETVPLRQGGSGQGEPIPESYREDTRSSIADEYAYPGWPYYSGWHGYPSYRSWRNRSGWDRRPFFPQFLPFGYWLAPHPTPHLGGGAPGFERRPFRPHRDFRRW